MPLPSCHVTRPSPGLGVPSRPRAAARRRQTRASLQVQGPGPAAGPGPDCQGDSRSDGAAETTKLKINPELKANSKGQCAKSQMNCKDPTTYNHLY
eukprot:767753-Hanusia_phi.AAC.5